MATRRQIDLHGAIEARDPLGRTLRLHAEGAKLTLETDGLDALLAALRAWRAVPGLPGLEGLGRAVRERLADFAIEIRVRGHRVARLGRGARVGWLESRVARLPVEADYGALLRLLLGRR